MPVTFNEDDYEDVKPQASEDQLGELLGLENSRYYIKELHSIRKWIEDGTVLLKVAKQRPRGGASRSYRRTMSRGQFLLRFPNGVADAAPDDPSTPPTSPAMRGSGSRKSPRTSLDNRPALLIFLRYRLDIVADGWHLKATHAQWNHSAVLHPIRPDEAYGKSPPWWTFTADRRVYSTEKELAYAMLSKAFGLQLGDIDRFFLIRAGRKEYRSGSVDEFRQIPGIEYLTETKVVLADYVSLVEPTPVIGLPYFSFFTTPAFRSPPAQTDDKQCTDIDGLLWAWRPIHAATALSNARPKLQPQVSTVERTADGELLPPELQPLLAELQRSTTLKGHETRVRFRQLRIGQNLGLSSPGWFRLQALLLQMEGADSANPPGPNRRYMPRFFEILPNVEADEFADAALKARQYLGDFAVCPIGNIRLRVARSFVDGGLGMGVKEMSMQGRENHESDDDTKNTVEDSDHVANEFAAVQIALLGMHWGPACQLGEDVVQGLRSIVRNSYADANVERELPRSPSLARGTSIIVQKPSKPSQYALTQLSKDPALSGDVVPMLLFELLSEDGPLTKLRGLKRKWKLGVGPRKAWQYMRDEIVYAHTKLSGLDPLPWTAYRHLSGAPEDQEASPTMALLKAMESLIKAMDSYRHWPSLQAAMIEASCRVHGSLDSSSVIVGGSTRLWLSGFRKSTMSASGGVMQDPMHLSASLLLQDCALPVNWSSLGAILDATLGNARPSEKVRQLALWFQVNEHVAQTIYDYLLTVDQGYSSLDDGDEKENELTLGACLSSTPPPELPTHCCIVHDQVAAETAQQEAVALSTALAKRLALVIPEDVSVAKTLSGARRKAWVWQTIIVRTCAGLLRTMPALNVVADRDAAGGIWCLFAQIQATLKFLPSLAPWQCLWALRHATAMSTQLAELFAHEGSSAAAELHPYKSPIVMHLKPPTARIVHVGGQDDEELCVAQIVRFARDHRIYFTPSYWPWADTWRCSSIARGGGNITGYTNHSQSARNSIEGVAASRPRSSIRSQRRPSHPIAGATVGERVDGAIGVKDVGDLRGCLDREPQLRVLVGWPCGIRGPNAQCIRMCRLELGEAEPIARRMTTESRRDSMNMARTRGRRRSSAMVCRTTSRRRATEKDSQQQHHVKARMALDDFGLLKRLVENMDRINVGSVIYCSSAACSGLAGAELVEGPMHDGYEGLVIDINLNGEQMQARALVDCQHVVVEVPDKKTLQKLADSKNPFLSDNVLFTWSFKNVYNEPLSSGRGPEKLRSVFNTYLRSDYTAKTVPGTLVFMKYVAKIWIKPVFVRSEGGQKVQEHCLGFEVKFSAKQIFCQEKDDALILEAGIGGRVTMNFIVVPGVVFLPTGMRVRIFQLGNSIFGRCGTVECYLPKEGLFRVRLDTSLEEEKQLADEFKKVGGFQRVVTTAGPKLFVEEAPQAPVTSVVVRTRRSSRLRRYSEELDLDNESASSCGLEVPKTPEAPSAPPSRRGSKASLLGTEAEEDVRALSRQTSADVQAKKQSDEFEKNQMMQLSRYANMDALCKAFNPLHGSFEPAGIYRYAVDQPLVVFRGGHWMDAVVRSRGGANAHFLEIARTANSRLAREWMDLNETNHTPAWLPCREFEVLFTYDQRRTTQRYGFIVDPATGRSLDVLQLPIPLHWVNLELEGMRVTLANAIALLYDEDETEVDADKNGSALDASDSASSASSGTDDSLTRLRGPAWKALEDAVKGEALHLGRAFGAIPEYGYVVWGAQNSGKTVLAQRLAVSSARRGLMLPLVVDASALEPFVLAGEVDLFAAWNQAYYGFSQRGVMLQQAFHARRVVVIIDSADANETYFEALLMLLSMQVLIGHTIVLLAQPPSEGPLPALPVTLRQMEIGLLGKGEQGEVCVARLGANLAAIFERVRAASEQAMAQAVVLSLLLSVAENIFETKFEASSRRGISGVNFDMTPTEGMHHAATLAMLHCFGWDVAACLNGSQDARTAEWMLILEVLAYACMHGKTETLSMKAIPYILHSWLPRALDLWSRASRSVCEGWLPIVEVRKGQVFAFRHPTLLDYFAASAWVRAYLEEKGGELVPLAQMCIGRSHHMSAFIFELLDGQDGAHIIEIDFTHLKTQNYNVAAQRLVDSVRRVWKAPVLNMKFTCQQLTLLAGTSMQTAHRGLKFLEDLLHHVRFGLRQLSLAGCFLGYEGAALLANAFKSHDTNRGPEEDVDQLMIRIVALDVRDCGLGADGAELLANGLVNGAYLSTAFFGGNMIGHRGVAGVVRVLSSSQSLTSLGLERNGLGHFGAEQMIKALSAGGALRELNLADNRFTDDAAPALGKLLGGAKAVRTLDLSENGLSMLGAERLMAAREESTLMVNLKLDGNEFAALGAFHLRALLGEASLRSLSLEYCDLAAEGIGHLASMLMEAPPLLESLDLRGNHFGAAGMWLLGPALVRGGRALRRLGLAANGLWEDGAVALAQAYDRGRTLALLDYPEWCLLEDLDVSSNRIGAEGVTRLCEVLFASGQVATPRLKIVNFACSNIGPHGAISLSKALSPLERAEPVCEMGRGWKDHISCYMSAVEDQIVSLKIDQLSLQRLILTDNAIGDTGVKAIVRAVTAGLLTKLVCLELQRNFISHIGAAALLAIIPNVLHLRHILFEGNIVLNWDENKLMDLCAWRRGLDWSESDASKVEAVRHQDRKRTASWSSEKET